MRSRPVSPGGMKKSFARSHRSARAAALVALLVAFLTASTLSAGAQAVKTASTTPPPEASRFDIYGGYGYLHPVDSTVFNVQYQPINPGAVASATGYFNRYLGIQAEGSFFPSGPNDCVFTAQAGPILRYQKNRFVPFIHILGGGAKVGGPIFQPCTWGWGVTGGIGFDYILPVWNNRIAIRPIQSDFHYSAVDYGPADPGRVTGGGIGEIYAYRLSAGLVLRLGQVTPPPPVQLGCTVQPANVFPGDPVTVTATTTNLDPKKKATYTWTTSGGQIKGNDTTATVTTAGLPPGDYTVSGHVTEGMRPGQTASCTAGFRVHAYEPPTITCSANPSTVMPGDPSTITSVAVSPQNRPLTYSYSASVGTDSQQHADRYPGHNRRDCRQHDQRHLQRRRRPWQTGNRQHVGHHRHSSAAGGATAHATSAASPLSATESVLSASTTKPKVASMTSLSPSTASPPPSW